MRSTLPRSLPNLAAIMNALTIVTLGLILAVVAESRGITGGLGPQQFAGPGEQALVQTVVQPFFSD